MLNTGLLDRIASGMDDSSSLEEIYDAYCILSSRTTRSTCPSRSASVGFRAAKRCARLQLTSLPSLTRSRMRRAGRRWIRKNRRALQGRPMHEQMRLAARCISEAEARQAFAASGF